MFSHSGDYVIEYDYHINLSITAAGFMHPHYSTIHPIIVCLSCRIIAGFCVEMQNNMHV